MASNANDLNIKLKSNKFQLKTINTNGPKVVYHVAFVLDDTLYIHGGLVNKNDKKPCNNLFKFDFQSGWHDITPVNSPSLSNHCAIVQDTYVLFIGGWNGNNRISDVYVYDTKNNEILNTRTSGFPNGAGLSSHACNNLSDNSIIIFGREGSLRIQRKYGNCFLLKGSIKSLVYKYEELEVDTASRSGHATLSIDKNHIIVIGGRKDKVTEIHKFQTNDVVVHENLIWKELNSFVLDKNLEFKKSPGGRRFSAIIKIGDFCLIHAGETFDSHFRAPQQDLIILQLSTMKWYNMGDCGISIQNHTISCVNKRLIIVGGLVLNNKINEKTYELTLND